MAIELSPPGCFAILLQLGLILYEDPERWMTLPQFLRRWQAVVGTSLGSAALGYASHRRFFDDLQRVQLVRSVEIDGIPHYRPRLHFWYRISDIAWTIFAAQSD